MPIHSLREEDHQGKWRCRDVDPRASPKSAGQLQWKTARATAAGEKEEVATQTVPEQDRQGKSGTGMLIQGLRICHLQWKKDRQGKSGTGM